jgi:hypothetical protein
MKLLVNLIPFRFSDLKKCFVNLLPDTIEKISHSLLCVLDELTLMFWLTFFLTRLPVFRECRLKSNTSCRLRCRLRSFTKFIPVYQICTQLGSYV